MVLLVVPFFEDVNVNIISSERDFGVLKAYVVPTVLEHV
jgi:hypothetical protein